MDAVQNQKSIINDLKCGKEFDGRWCQMPPINPIIPIMCYRLYNIKHDIIIHSQQGSLCTVVGLIGRLKFLHNCVLSHVFNQAYCNNFLH